MVRFFTPKNCQKILCSFFTEPILAKTNTAEYIYVAHVAHGYRFWRSGTMLSEANSFVFIASQSCERREILDGWSSVEPLGESKKTLQIHEIYSFFWKRPCNFWRDFEATIPGGLFLFWFLTSSGQLFCLKKPS